MSTRHSLSLTLTFALVGLATAASADTRLTVRTKQGEMEVLGKVHPAKTSEATLWFGKERFRKDASPLGFIVRFDQKLFHILDHVNRTYITLKLPFVLRDHLPAELAEQFKNAEALKPKVTVVDTGEIRKIGRWSSRHCIGKLSTQSAMEQESHIWATRDLAIESTLYARAIAVMGSLAPIKLPIEELEGACGGFPVLRETKGEFYGSSFSMREELISAEVLKPPAGLYDPPAGYRKREVNGIDLLQLTPYDPDPEDM